MNKWIPVTLLVFTGIFLLTTAQAADVVPDEVSSFESPDKCDDCDSGNNDANSNLAVTTGMA